MARKEKQRRRRNRAAAPGRTGIGPATAPPVPDPREPDPPEPGPPAGFSGAFSRRGGLALVVLALLIAASYFPATRLGFVWDDVILTTLDAIREWGGLADLWFAPGSAYRQGRIGEDHYWPLLYTTFWLEHKLWGFAPAGYHIVNLLIHFANTALVGRLLERLGVPGAWFAAALFAVHPLHVESVAWVIARKDLLATLFFLAAFLAWLRFVEGPRAGRYAAALALYAAGMLCKSIAVTLPAALLIWHWWRRGRVTGAELRRLLPFFVVGLAIAGLDLWIYEKVNLSFDHSPVERLQIAAHSLVFYAGKLLWPADLALLYPHWEIGVASPSAWGYVAGVAAALGLLWWLRHRTGRGPLACVLFFAVALSPVLGFMDFGYMNVSFVADRYQYLAGAGIVALVAGAAATGAGRLPGAARKAAWGIAGAVLLVLGAATWNQTRVYEDDVTLFGHGAAVNSASWAANYYAGTELNKLRRFDEAEGLLLRAHALKPRNSAILVQLAAAQRRRGRYAESVETYRALIGIEPGRASVHAALGDALFRLERYAEAVAALERALSLRQHRPAAGPVHRRLGHALMTLERTEEAAQHYERALEIDPRDAESIDRLAWLRFRQNDYRAALRLYRKRLEIGPEDAAVHSNIAASLYHLGRPEEALRGFERALALDPGHQPAQVGAVEARKRLAPERTRDVPERTRVAPERTRDAD